MRYVAAYLLALLGGNPAPDVNAISKILVSVGIQCDRERAVRVVDALKGKDTNEIITKGQSIVDNMQFTGQLLQSTALRENDIHSFQQESSETVSDDPEVRPLLTPPPEELDNEGLFDLFA